VIIRFFTGSVFNLKKITINTRYLFVLINSFMIIKKYNSNFSQSLSRRNGINTKWTYLNE